MKDREDFLIKLLDNLLCTVDIAIDELVILNDDETATCRRLLKNAYELTVQEMEKLEVE